MLAPGEAKHFCGFYLDCHLAVSFASVRQTKTLGEGTQQRAARGTYYVVSVRVSSDARAATVRLDDPDAYIVDAHGRRYDRSPEDEQAPRSVRGMATLTGTVAPNGFYFAELVFDLPDDTDEPRLFISEGPWLNRFAKRFIVGNEESLFHKKMTFALD